jgi:hypothetical protein
MKPGPPPIPFPLKRLRGNPGHQRLHADSTRGTMSRSAGVS